MAVLPNSGLETTPAGTTNLPGLVNGNWTLIENWFDVQTWFGLKQPNFATVAYGASVAINFAGARKQAITLGGNITFTFSNLAAGRETTIYIKGDPSLSRNLTWPASVVWLGGSAPSSLASAKTLRVTFFSQASGASGVIAEFTVEP